MDMGSLRTARMALVMLLVLSLLVMVATLAAPERAEAHQQPGRTLIYVDGAFAKATKDDHFTYDRRLARGCHTVKVVQRQGGEVVFSSIMRFCSDERTRLIVKVDDGSVSSSTYSTNSASRLSPYRPSRRSPCLRNSETGAFLQGGSAERKGARSVWW